MHPPASRALRREILRLALLDPGDLEVLIGQLTPAHRGRVQALLGEALVLDGGPRNAGIASWIEDRIEGRVDGMTEQGRLALAHCAGHAIPTRAASEMLPGRSLVERAFSPFGRGRR